VIGIDSDLNSLKRHATIQHRVGGDILRLPFRDNSFDLVTANMVFEHIKLPEIVLTEVYRVLKPGGILLFHTPNARGYPTIIARVIPERIKAWLVWWLQKRKEEDLYPAFYRINLEEDIQRISSSIGFRVHNIAHIVSSAQTAIFFPLAMIELIVIRLLMKPTFEKYRTNLIVSLQKPGRCANVT